MLHDHITGEDKTKKSKEDQISYRPHYTYFVKMCSAIADRRSAYHVSILADATRDIVTTGRYMFPFHDTDHTSILNNLLGAPYSEEIQSQQFPLTRAFLAT